MMATTGHTYLDHTYCCRKELLLGSIFVNGDVHGSITLGYGRKFITDLPNDGYFLSHCDDILCLYGCFNIHLFNPCTNECQTLPQGNLVSCHFTDLGAHNPRVQVHIGEWHRKLVQLGFARDQATKQYKIVKVFNLDLYDKSHPDLCEIFTLDSNPSASWKILGVVPYRIALSATPVHVNGAIYWFTDAIYNLFKSDIVVIIVMFDIHEEKFEAIPHPSCCSHPPKVLRPMQLGCLRGCLCLAEQESDTQLNIWIMEDMTNWEKLLGINLLLISFQVAGFRFSVTELKHGTIIICGCRNEMYFYNPKSRNLSFGLVPHGVTWSVPTTFVESLFRLN